MTQALATVDLSIPAMREWRKVPEGILAEVFDSTLYVSPSPTPYHCRTAAVIFYSLMRHILKSGSGEVFHAPIDVYLKNGTNVVVPDIVLVTTYNNIIIDHKGIHGSPDLHIEILSPGTRKRDLTIRKQLYEEAGVKEYWIVDPITKDAWGYLLENDRYDGPVTMNSKIHVRVLSKIIPF